VALEDHRPRGVAHGREQDGAGREQLVAAPRDVDERVETVAKAVQARALMARTLPAPRRLARHRFRPPRRGGTRHRPLLLAAIRGRGIEGREFAVGGASVIAVAR
jgi:hypothetical protein